MPVSEKEHDRARIIEFIHCVEIGHLRYVNEIYGGELAYLFCQLVECLVHLHARGVPIVAETNDHHTLLFCQNGLVNLPTIVQVWKQIRHC